MYIHFHYIQYICSHYICTYIHIISMYSLYICIRYVHIYKCIDILILYDESVYTFSPE